MFNGVGCSVFLNNRYYDPTTGVFLSVDQLVSTTGDPYLYAAGNPTTLSDPSGLDPGCRAGMPYSGCSPEIYQWRSTEGPASSEATAGSYQVLATRQELQLVPNRITGPEHVGPRHGDVRSDGYVYTCGPDGVASSSGCDWMSLALLPPAMPPIGDAPRLWADILAGFDAGAPGGGAMLCSDAGVGVGSVTSCVMADTSGVSVLTTVGAGPSTGKPALAGSVGVAISNADAEKLSQWGMCGNASGGAGFGGAGALCGSLSYEDGQWGYSGAWTFYGGVSVTTPGWSAGYAYTYTWVSQMITWPWA